MKAAERRPTRIQRRSSSVPCQWQGPLAGTARREAGVGFSFFSLRDALLKLAGFFQLLMNRARAQL